jgi:hypothetical protein
MKKSPGSGKEAKPLQNKEEVQQNPDKHIDQDFPGYPHPPSQEKTINPKTKEDKANARLVKKDKYTDDDQDSDGSANAFGESENDVLRGELDKDEEKNY